MNKFSHLQETGPVGNNSHDEWKRDEYVARVASVFSLFEITPAVVANVELKTSQGLHLSTQKGQIVIRGKERKKRILIHGLKLEINLA